jgi:hypothetical protein
MRRIHFYSLLLLFTPFFFLGTFKQDLLTGSVQDQTGRPVAAATVRWQSVQSCTRTDAKGHFQIPSPKGPLRLTATKEGFRIGWTQTTPFDIKLAPIPAKDNDDYAWTAPDPDPAQPNNCANCHEAIHREWAGSAHARSANNAKFLALFDGSGSRAAKSSTWNLKAQNPDGAGVCVNCHAPTFQDPTLEYDFRSIKNAAARGVHCDYCHKIAAAPTDKLGTRQGRDGYPLLRPTDGDVFFFGPLPDAVRPGESFIHAPLYKESRYCASCHEGVLFGVHAYGTYSEWLASPARKAGLECQNCHMKPSGTMTNIAPGHGGIERDSKTLANHSFSGGSLDLLRQCVKTQIAIVKEKDQVKAAAELSATQVGHDVPTGFIDRHLILVVEGWDAQGRPVAATSGPKLDGAAGSGLAGQAGWLYAKRLYAGTTSPLPFWLPADKMTDTRLKPHVPDRRSFAFPATAAEIRVRVIYRRFWAAVAEPYSWDDNDLLLFNQRLLVK